MRTGFRQSMTWLHTWTGLVVGWVLFFVFVTGTVGYFYAEIDRWMRPELPLAGAWPSIERSVLAADATLRDVAPSADYWWIELPTGRQSTGLRVSWGTGPAIARGQERRLMFVPALEAFRPEVPVRATEGAYGLYRMHWKLRYVPQRLAVGLVGACTMILLVALATGIVAHRKLFADFFTFRPGGGGRAWLDVHNLASVTALPFLLMITFSGLVFYMETYVPAGLVAAYGDDRRAYREALEPAHPVSRAHVSAPLRRLDRFLEAAAPHWGDAGPDRISVQYPGDANAEVVLYHDGQGTILRDVGEALRFQGVDGTLIRQVTARRSWPQRTYSGLLGLHEGVFAGPGLRWLYVGSGLLGCVMIATGLILWTVKRRATHDRVGLPGVGFRLVECLNIGSIAGLPAAVAGYLWANRLLPADFGGRASWEFHSLFIAWGLLLCYPAVRAPRRAWVEELWVAAVAFGGVPLINALTTDRHLGTTIPANAWDLAGVDLTALTLGIGFAAAATMTSRRTAAARPFATAAERRRRGLSPRYQWGVASRVVAAFAGGYGVTWLSTAALAVLARDLGAVPRVDAVVGSTMASFALYAVIVMAVFHARSAGRAWTGLLLAAVPPGLVLAFVQGGAAG